MFNRDNLIGVLLVGVCAVVAGVLLYSIASGERLEVDLPGWLGVVLTVVFLGLIIFGFLSSGGFGRLFRRGGQGGPQWPHPEAGKRRRWPWQRR
jgi:hypothetical protein